MTMPIDRFIIVAAEDAFDTYLNGGDSRLDLSYPALIYGISESVLYNLVSLKTKALLENHAQEVLQ
jgi:hypothetical protein